MHDGAGVIPANRIFRLPAASTHDDAIDTFWRHAPGALGPIARTWFDVMRVCGTDVRELLHDGHPTVCVGDVAFAYVNVFSAHVNVGFFHGAELPDPAQLLVGSGKYMRHVKLLPKHDVNAVALAGLITAAYDDVKRRLANV